MNIYLEKIAGLPSVEKAVEYIPKGVHVDFNKGDVLKNKFLTKNKAIAAGALVGLGAVGSLAHSAGKNHGDTRAKSINTSPSAYQTTRKKFLEKEPSKVGQGVSTAITAGIYGATGRYAGSALAKGTILRDLHRTGMSNMSLNQAQAKLFQQGIRNRVATGGRYGAVAGALLGASFGSGALKGYDEKRKELAEKAQMKKQASAQVEAAKGLGSYLLHNVVTPIAPIFVADLAAHRVADAMEQKEKSKLMKKVAEIIAK